jgi:hypothetical protein
MYMKKKIWKKCFRQKINYFYYYILLTVIQCKQKYIRTSLPCNVTVVDLKYIFFIFKAYKFSIMQD